MALVPTHLTHNDDSGRGRVGAPTRVLTVGRWDQREFAAAAADIPTAVEWEAAQSISEACDILRCGNQPFEIVLLAQPHPGQIRQTDVDRLQHLAPLTRLVIVAGTWCEGELRSGTPPMGAIRLYWYEFATWWRAAIRRRDAQLCPHWSLPLDHPQAGRCSVERRQMGPTRITTTIQVNTSDYISFETLAAALREEGIACSYEPAATPGVSQRGQAGNTQHEDVPRLWGGIWDGGQLCGEELQRLTDFCSRVPGPIVALLDFPRVEHVGLIRSAGAAGVLAKPYIVEELISMLTGE